MSTGQPGTLGLGAEPGASNAQVARDLGVSVATVRRWRAAFARG
ncbi:helix-turn-helix domain-containing protein, partial [Actinoallomurus sp. NPDC052308]